MTETYIVQKAEKILSWGCNLFKLLILKHSWGLVVLKLLKWCVVNVQLGSSIAEKSKLRYYWGFDLFKLQK